MTYWFIYLFIYYDLMATSYLTKSIQIHKMRRLWGIREHQASTENEIQTCFFIQRTQ